MYIYHVTWTTCWEKEKGATFKVSGEKNIGDMLKKKETVWFFPPFTCYSMFRVTCAFVTEIGLRYACVRFQRFYL